MEAFITGKNESLPKAATRKMMKEYLAESVIPIRNGNDANSIMRDMMSALTEDTFNQELDEWLSYTKYVEYLRSNYLKKVTGSLTENKAQL